jgi:hypothetical protein
MRCMVSSARRASWFTDSEICWYVDSPSAITG